MTLLQRCVPILCNSDPDWWLVRPGAVSRSHTFSNCTQSPRCDLLNVADAWHLKNCTTSENFCGQKCNLFNILKEETTTTPNFSFELLYQEQGQHEWKSYHPPRENLACVFLCPVLSLVYTRLNRTQPNMKSWSTVVPLFWPRLSASLTPLQCVTSTSAAEGGPPIWASTIPRHSSAARQPACWPRYIFHSTRLPSLPCLWHQKF